jgi:hypothetical protein
MKEGHVFTKAELEEMGKRTRDLIDEAIDAGDLERAKRLNHRMYSEFLAMHDLFRDWITSTLSYVYEHHGEETLYEAMREGCSRWFRPLAQAYEKADFRRKVEMLAMGLRGHLQPMEVTEDHEKVCITMHPCGTGERLIQEGAYGPPKDFSTVKGPHVMTWGRSNCPIYCAHEPVLEILPMEWGGHPLWVVQAPEDRWGGCSFCIYKDPKHIPDELYERVGKKKPRT